MAMLWLTRLVRIACPLHKFYSPTVFLLWIFSRRRFMASLHRDSVGPAYFFSPIFGDNMMMLQRGKPNSVCGWTKPGEKVRGEIEGENKSNFIVRSSVRWPVERAVIGSGRGLGGKPLA